MRKTKGHKESVYSVAINSLGTLAASGSTDQIIRLWDVRSGEKAMKLRVRLVAASLEDCLATVTDGARGTTSMNW